MSDPELGALHRELVAISGQLTEAEFWEGREVIQTSLCKLTLLIVFLLQHLLLALAASENQHKGKPGQLVDPRPETVDGETKILITPQLTHDIFDEYPVVAKAHSENVPNKVWLHPRALLTLC